METKDLSKKISFSSKLIVILFTLGGEVKIKDLEKEFGIEIEDVVREAREKLKDFGLSIVTDGNSLQMAVLPDFRHVIESWNERQRSSSLSEVALETLAVVSYLGGATKPEVDFIRGVNSYLALRGLTMKGMISISSDGVYHPSIEALSNLGVSNLRDLPDWDTVNGSLRLQLNNSSLITE